METLHTELENYIETYFMISSDLPDLFKYTKYRIVKEKRAFKPKDAVNVPVNVFYAKIKGRGKKRIETIFTVEELKDALNKLLVHNITDFVADDYLLVYDTEKVVEIGSQASDKKLVEIENHLSILYASHDPYVVEKIEYLTRGALRLFALYDPTRYSSIQDFLKEYKDEFTKRLVTRVNDWCFIEAFKRVFAIGIRADITQERPMCLFFDVM
ncbi:hypothetical protein [Metallosphaera cuprina]|uniref:Uncharacterized protein n=1 Tax=Metallosphaera cuprina (strain Ar-4) TaxID=1006006 RepID=F4G2J3_METCR|nr:hypothetical protein [Metallosphaera cuprina]AEB95041.1 hypothetical protein Mcup_0936 [Metallosphaera cuprina Ar-4]